MKNFGFAVVCLLCFESNILGHADFPFRNTSLSFEERTKDLVGRLTLDEKIAQMSHGGANKNSPTPAILRLGIEPYQFGTECLRGDVGAGDATAFPQALGLAAAFDEDLMFRVAEATSVEVRAKNNFYLNHSDYSFHHGLSCWSPVINIARDPRWGRNQETYGEDPFMSGKLAQAFVQGLQGNNTRYFRTVAGCKHFDAYGGPENIPELRFGFNAEVSDIDLHMTFLPAFQACVEAGSFSVMCSYNAVNGIPACASKTLLTDVLRNTWNFEGYVVSDEGALEDIVYGHNYTKTFVAAGVAAVNAGCNLEDGNFAYNVFSTLGDAVKQELVSENTINDSVYRLFLSRMKLGEFDPPGMNPYKKLGLSQVASKEHKELSLEAAMKSFVLLKNDKQLLPLNVGDMKIAVVGPFSNRPDLLYGDYPPDALFTVTPFVGIKGAQKGDVVMEEGCVGPQCPSLNKEAVAKATSVSDVVVLCLGLSQEIESEGRDRKDISLPGLQLELMQYVSSLGKPVVLILFTAGPVEISWAKDNVPSVLLAFYPAQSAGTALANVLFGDYNPGGRLPATWPLSMKGYPPITNYSMTGRTYRYQEATVPLYPFGYGLSYTNFTYSNLKVVPSEVKPCQNVSINVTITNTGSLQGDEVVELYLKRNDSVYPYPRVWLVGFGRYSLNSGSSVTAGFTIVSRQMSVYDTKMSAMVLEPGVFLVYAGGQQPGQTTSTTSNVLQGSFNLSGAATKLSSC